jgi:hypothetical protein
MSMWISSPACRRAYRFGGSGGSSRESRFRPRRVRTAQTVDTAIPSFAAIAELVIRDRRSRSITTSTFSGVRVGHDAGRLDRSVIGSPAS